MPKFWMISARNGGGTGIAHCFNSLKDLKSTPSGNTNSTGAAK
jgi:hypothetical protein